MIDIEVAVTCETCGAVESDMFGAEYMVDSFFKDREREGWDEEMTTCPKCADVRINCSYCFEQTPPGKTEADLPELGWRQHTSADMRSLITLCDECGKYYDQFRS